MRDTALPGAPSGEQAPITGEQAPVTEVQALVADAHFTLIGRAYCGLCDEMRAALAPVAAAHGIRIVEIDVDTDAALEARWGELVPVLFLGAPGAGRELCHYHFEADRVRAALAGE